MKRKLLTALLGLFTAALWAQEDQSATPKLIEQRKHELRLDALEALAVPNIEISYEYVLSRYSGVGTSVSFSLDQDFDEYQAWALTPFYRQYFFNKKEFGARGFFVEGLLKIAGGTEENFDYLVTIDGPTTEIVTRENWFNAGIGIALGQKWVSNNGFVFELSLGGGRYLIDDQDGPEAFLRGGVLVGYRF
ncbi:hypothetical protein [Gilvibacter sp.]|uniref:hypothetical protein n=1 Tax=Gilvibacter sp. TaxID=2729997 RepID=UPI003B51E327